LRARHPKIREVRGAGLLIGIEIDGNARDVVQACMARRLLVLTAGDTVVRMVPPLIITEAEADRAVDTLDQALGATLR
jgi:acetylornithine/succinyldiaminopimelate/putrescine aminotransferase